MGPAFYIGTLAAVVLGGASTVGGVGLGYTFGISGMWLVFWLGGGIITLSLLFSATLTRLKVYSLPELLERRYGTASSRAISGVVMIGYDLMLTVTSVLAMGTVVDVLLDVPRIPAILIGGGVVVFYSVLGGMWSISLSDMLQFVIMTVGIFLILLPMTFNEVGGLSALQAELPDEFFSLTNIGGDTIFSYFLLYFFGIIVGQDVWQRVFTARSPRVAKYAGVGAGLYCLVYAVAGAVIGMTAAVLYPGLENSDDAFATVTSGVLPAGLSGLVLAAALAALMSTASAGLLASSTIFGNDVWSRLFKGRATAESIAESRWFTLAAGVIVIGISLIVQDVVAALTVAYNLLVGGLIVPVVGAMFWRRATGVAALAAMAVGSLVVIVLMLTQGLLANAPIYFGLGASAVTFVVVSLAGPRKYEPTLMERSKL